MMVPQHLFRSPSPQRQLKRPRSLPSSPAKAKRRCSKTREVPMPLSSLTNISTFDFDDNSGEDSEQNPQCHSHISSLDELSAMLQTQSFQGTTTARALANDFAKSTFDKLNSSNTPSSASFKHGASVSKRSGYFDTIRVNVSGTMYKAKRSLLTSVPGSHMAKLFKETELTVSLQINPKWFELILNWLRNRRPKPSWPMENASWIEEVRYLGLSTAMFGEGRLYIIGGEDHHGPFSAGHAFDRVGNSWTDVPNMEERRHSHAGSTYRGFPCISGGIDESGTILASASYFDTNKSKWIALPNMTSPRASHQVVTVKDTIFAIGGCRPKSSKPWFPIEKLSETDRFWTPVPCNRQIRSSFTTANCNGSIYLIGGLDQATNALILSVDRYDIASGLWYSVDPIPTPRRELTSAVLDGKIYVIGGKDETDKCSSAVEIYDPSTNNWTIGTSLSEPCCNAAAVALNGMIWLCGGKSNHEYSDKIRNYDPIYQEWKTRRQLPIAKSSIVACTAPY